MASVRFTDGSLTFNSVDYSAYVKDFSISWSRDSNDTSVQGSDARAFAAGAQSWTASGTFLQDYGSTTLDDRLWALADAGTSASLVLKPASGSPSATNPTYTGTAFITSYEPISGSYGDHVELSVSLQGSGSLTRATS